MAVVLASDLSKDMAGEPLLRGVSFKLERKDRMTLSGRNGSGKTTLLRMLSGETGIDGGELVFAEGRARSRCTTSARRATATSRCATTCCRAARSCSRSRRSWRRSRPRWPRARSTTRRSPPTARRRHGSSTPAATTGASRSTRRCTASASATSTWTAALETFSGGELTRASLARALAGDPDLLLLDEPTNHLDIESLEWLETHLQTLDAAIVLVAHDRWFLEAVGTSVLELEAGKTKFFKGTWHAWRAEKAQRELALGRAIEKQQTEIAKLERFVDRFSAGTRSRQASSRAKKLDKMDRRHDRGQGRQGPRLRLQAAGALRPRRLRGRGRAAEDRRPHAAAGRRAVARARRARVPGRRQRHRQDDADHGADRRARVRRRQAAHAATTSSSGCSAQHAESLGGTGTVVEACQRATRLTPNKARSLLGQFLFSGEDAEKPLDGLSGGERQRLSLAILVHSGANVLILDEPTNHLDVESREALESALQVFQGSLLLISHDRALLDAVGTRTVALEDQTLHSYVGGWPEYVRVREERADAARAAKRAKPVVEKAKPAPVAEVAKPRSKNEQARAKKLEAEIEKAEAALAALEVRAGRPGCVERSALGGQVDRAPRRGQADARRALRALGSRRKLTRSLG